MYAGFSVGSGVDVSQGSQGRHGEHRGFLYFSVLTVLPPVIPVILLRNLNNRYVALCWFVELRPYRTALLLKFG